MLDIYKSSSPIGTIPVIQFPIHTNSSSHIEELYQNLPQLNKPVFVPVTYKSYDYSFPADIYSPGIALARNHHAHEKSYQQQSHAKAMQQQNTGILEKGISSFFKRNGGNGWGGWGDVGGGWNNGNSPALSALALLGFMFFLNLIQTSLQNNRQMLASLNATTVGVVAGKNGRFKRETDYLEYKLTRPDPATTSHSSNGLTKSEVSSRVLPNYPSSRQRRLQNTGLPAQKLTDITSNTKIKTSKMESFKSTSLECFQLIACKLGRTIYDSLDTTTGFMVRMLGTSMLPQIPKTTWTGRLMRAFNKGWRTKQECDKMFRKCSFPNIYPFNFNTVTTMRKKKAFS